MRVERQALLRAARAMQAATRLLRCGRSEDALVTLVNAHWIARDDARELWRRERQGAPACDASRGPSVTP